MLFAGLGMLVGSDGLGWIGFDDYELARLIGTVALVLILFEGGLAADGVSCGRFCARRCCLRSSRTVVTVADHRVVAASWPV